MFRLMHPYTARLLAGARIDEGGSSLASGPNLEPRPSPGDAELSDARSSAGLPPPSTGQSVRACDASNVLCRLMTSAHDDGYERGGPDPCSRNTYSFSTAWLHMSGRRLIYVLGNFRGGVWS